MQRDPETRRIRRLAAALLASAVTCSVAARAEEQQSCPRILVQDPALNNLVDPPGYATAESGTLGGVVRAGEGPRPMILLPGLGFGGSVFDDLTKALATDFRTYAVTLAGFGGTAAPPAPPETTSFGEQTWTAGALAAIERLIAEENLDEIALVGHWLGGTQIAL
jgi:pimeloyl-ACP methyl ester carboxylesterase